MTTLVDTVQLLLIPTAIYVLILSLLLGPVAWKWRERAAWHRWEVATLLAPIGVWLGLLLAFDRGKSLSNLAVEPVYLAPAIAVIAWFRVVFARTVHPSRAAACGALLNAGAAWFVWWVVPGLPE